MSLLGGTPISTYLEPTESCNHPRDQSPICGSLGRRAQISSLAFSSHTGSSDGGTLDKNTEATTPLVGNDVGYLYDSDHLRGGPLVALVRSDQPFYYQ